MALNAKQKEILIDIARRLIGGMATVGEAAKAALRQRGGQSDGRLAVATMTNAMVHGGSPEVQSVAAIGSVRAAELRQLAEEEPFVARVTAKDEFGDVRTFYFARSMPLTKAQLGTLDGSLASYRAEVGRLAERAPGEEVTLHLSGSRTFTVVERVRLSPTRTGDGWDGRHDRIESHDLIVTLKSLSEFLSQFDPQLAIQDLLAEIEAVANEGAAVQQGLRRQLIDRMSLRDEAVLDQYQGEVFRLPLNRRVMLSGPPGTGKTTTLIKRIAQKTRIDEITAEERQLATSEMELFHPNNWVMYTPTELLKLYLKEAFNRESIAASDERVRTWTDERRRLGREVLHVLRSETGGRFILDDDANTVADVTSSAQIGLTDAFVSAFETQIVARYSAALAVLNQNEDTELAAVLARIKRHAGEGKITFRALFDLVDFHSDLTRHEQRLVAASEERLRSAINALLNSDRSLIDDLALTLDTATVGLEDDEDDDAEADVEDERHLAPRDRKAAAVRALRRAFSARAKELHDGKPRTRTGRNRHVLDWLGERVPDEAVLRSLGAVLVNLESVRFLGRTYQNLIQQVPVEYQRFRRNSLRAGRWYRPEARAAIERGRVVGAEVDVMLLIMLRNSGRFLGRTGSRALRAGTDTNIAVLDSVKGEYVTQVLVDEATDFSPVQLACMQELAHPEFRSFFVCGDFRQRVTPWGLRGIDDLRWVAGDFDLREITIGYRQSKRLAALASALSLLNGSIDTDLETPPYVDDADIPPLLVEDLRGEGLARWLLDRVREVERALGKVPSIAIFVDGDDHIDPLVKVARPLLVEHNLDVVGCKEGKVVGTDGQVRVFDVQYIKGLEFEAVFFLGVDALARRVPDLFDKYLFVGSTRATTYLALTCEGRLPEVLEPVRSHFSSGGW